MDHLFLNGPVQNGDFTFSDAPGKAVGIRIAEALNRILGTPAAPHLWNTVTLAGDLRYRSQHPIGPAQAALTRPLFETAVIAAKYGTGHEPPSGVVTDADREVADLAVEMISRRLADGRLMIRSETILQCANCHHMTGTDSHPCRACGHTASLARTMPHLVSDRCGQPALDFEHVYAPRRRPPLHLRNIAGNTPDRLILSRTRDHGIDLSPIGLPGLILDPRVGVHITVLAVAARLGASIAVMTTTQNAAANIAAYGQPFLDHDGLRLQYGLHGRVPYGHLSGPEDTYRVLRTHAQTRAGFERWFLPLVSLKHRKGIQAAQLPALLKYYRKALPAPYAHDNGANLLEEIRAAIREGDTDWLMRKPALTAALRTAWPCRATDGIATPGTRTARSFWSRATAGAASSGH